MAVVVNAAGPVPTQHRVATAGVRMPGRTVLAGSGFAQGLADLRNWHPRSCTPEGIRQLGRTKNVETAAILGIGRNGGAGRSIRAR